MVDPEHSSTGVKLIVVHEIHSSIAHFLVKVM